MTTLRKLPNLSDDKEMAARGRASALAAARNEACSELRDISTTAQHLPAKDLAAVCERLNAVAERFRALSLHAESS
jgi:hypothetical protein